MDIQLHDSYLALDPRMLLALAGSMMAFLFFFILRFGKKMKSMWINIGLIISGAAAVAMLWWLGQIVITFLDVIK